MSRNSVCHATLHVISCDIRRTQLAHATAQTKTHAPSGKVQTHGTNEARFQKWTCGMPQTFGMPHKVNIEVQETCGQTCRIFQISLADWRHAPAVLEKLHNHDTINCKKPENRRNAGTHSTTGGK